MSDLGNKKIMAKNIRYYMSKYSVSQTKICNTLGIKMPTFSDWVNAKTYPRIDKIELMANYFGISKADLVEEHDTLSKSPKIMDYYNQLNDIGKHEATKRVEELTNLPQYINEPDRFMVNAAHAISNSSEEAKQHDEDIMDDEDF